MFSSQPAILSAGATIFVCQGLRDNTPYTGFWINLVVGTIGLWVGVLAMGGVGRVSAAGLGLFGLAGLIGTVGGRRIVNMNALRRWSPRPWTAAT